MALILFILAIIILVTLASIGKKAKNNTKILNDNAGQDADQALEHQRKLQQADELITTILPTIKKSK